MNKRDKPLAYNVPEAGALIGLSRSASYEAARRGQIPTIKIGSRILVPRATFHRMFGDHGSTTQTQGSGSVEPTSASRAGAAE